MTLLLILAAVSAAAVAIAAAGQQHPLRRVGLSALCGASALGLVNAFSGYTGVSIALNYATAFVSTVLGLPGVVVLLAVRPLL